MKKSFSFFSIILFLSVLFLFVACENKNDEKEQVKYSEGLSYLLNDDGKSYTVNDLGDCVDSNVYIPETYNNLPVTELSGFKNIDTRFRLYLPKSITKINEGSFYESNGLVALNFSGSVKNIESICNFGSIPSIYFEGTLEEWCEINLAGNFGKNMHINGKLVTELTVPNSIKIIKSQTFYCFSELEKIIIPKQITKIESNAFTNCLKVKDIYFEDLQSTWEIDLYGSKISLSVNELHNGKAYEYLIGGKGPLQSGNAFTKIS